MSVSAAVCTSVSLVVAFTFCWASVVVVVSGQSAGGGATTPSPPPPRYARFADLAARSDWQEVQLHGPGGDLTRHLESKDAHLPQLRREYVVHVPDAYVRQPSPGKELFPVLWYFHGQGMNPDLSIQETDYNQVADHNNYFVVYPKGIGRGQDGGVEGTGWNVGTAGDNSTCGREAWSEFGCNCTSCYNSCETLGYCNSTLPSSENNCGWSTCYDDIAFVQDIAKDLKENFAVDEKKMFVTGCSNGGMMTHHVYGQLPHMFRAAIPNYALPLEGYLNVPNSSRMPFLAIHDRWDYIIPIRGGVSTEGWKYASLADVMQAWGKVHDCDTDELVPWTTPQDGGPRRFECTAFKGCKTEKGEDAKLGLVAQCLWDGYHGDWPADGVIAKVTFWWIKTHVLHETPNNITEPMITSPSSSSFDGANCEKMGPSRALAQH